MASGIAHNSNTIHSIEIRPHVAPESGMVLADATLMQQVLLNLCSIAEHAMHGGERVLEVRVEAVEGVDSTPGQGTRSRFSSFPLTAGR